jgi:integrase
MGSTLVLKEDVMATIYKREKADGTFVYWTKFRRDGQLIRQNTGTDNRQKAEKFLRNQLNAVDEGVAPDVDVRRVTYVQIREELVRHYQTTQCREEGEYSKRLAHLDEFFSHHRAAAIAGAEITKYVEFRQGQLVHRSNGPATPPANATINRELLVLSKMLNLAHENRRLVHVPKITTLKEAKPREGFVNDTQFERIRKNLDADLQVVAVLGYTYGMRISEVLGLDWTHVDFAAREIRLVDTKNEDPRVLTFDAGDEVEVLLHEQRARVAANVEAFPDHKIPACVFPMLPGIAGVPQSLVGRRRGGIERPWASATKAAGLAGILFHDLRRSAVRNLINSGVSQQVAQKISGHRSADVFSRYNIVAADDKRDAMRKVREARQAGVLAGER